MRIQDDEDNEWDIARYLAARDLDARHEAEANGEAEDDLRGEPDEAVGTQEGGADTDGGAGADAVEVVANGVEKVEIDSQE